MKNFICLFVLSSICQAYSQVNLSYYLEENHKYNPEIPKPNEVLGYEVGSWHVSHDQLLNYMYRLAESSDRITIENRGKTYEDRPLILLTITSPENHKNIRNIQKNHLKLTEINNDLIDIKKEPIVIYQGFSVHGNEPSGSNASLIAAYHLAASQEEDTIDMLNNMIILFDPSYNPDGLQRFSYWANTNRNNILTSDPNDREYNEIWPGGRTNHYWFDLNRDWLPVQLPETRARIKTYNKWLPNLLTDHHEMGTNSSFFFQPGIPERVNPLITDLNQKLTKKISEFHVEAFDKLGSLYYSEESYDDFYLGKGSAFPDINGGIGILFEQASSRGHIQNTENGLLSFPFTIRNQLTAVFSTLKAANNMREEILIYFKNFYKKSINDSFKSKQKAILFGSPKDPATSFEFAKILESHDIRFNKLLKDIKREGKQYFKESSYIVPLNQKKNKLIRAMFNVQKTFKDSLFYDVSAWTFPFAFNLNYNYETTTSLIGDEITLLKPSKGFVNMKGEYAYLFEPHNYYAPKLINYLHENNIRVKVGLTPFTLNGKNYDYGTYMIPSKNQEISEENLYNILKEGAIKTKIKITGVSTGNTKGIDLGSRDFKKVKKVKIALLVGKGIRSYDAGEIWHLLDTRHEIAISKIDIKDLTAIDIKNYTHLIIPSYEGNNLNMSSDKIKEFVYNGGVLIGYRYSIKWLKENELINVEFLEHNHKAYNVSFENKNKFNGAQITGGAIFNTNIDRSHPINFGYLNDNIPLFRNTNLFIKADEQSYNNPIQYTSNPLLAGYISKENLAVLKKTVPFKTIQYGKGRIIIMTDNTNFRAFWYGTNRILTNAIFLSDLM